MPRVIISMPTNSYSGDTRSFVLPEMSEERSSEIAVILAKGHLVERHEFNGDRVWVSDAGNAIASSITPGESVLSRKQLAAMKAEREKARADEARIEAEKALRLATEEEEDLAEEVEA